MQCNDDFVFFQKHGSLNDVIPEQHSCILSVKWMKKKKRTTAHWAGQFRRANDPSTRHQNLGSQLSVTVKLTSQSTNLSLGQHRLVQRARSREGAGLLCSHQQLPPPLPGGLLSSCAQPCLSQRGSAVQSMAEACACVSECLVLKNWETRPFSCVL